MKLKNYRALTVLRPIFINLFILPKYISEIIKKCPESLDITWEGQYFLNTLENCLLSRFCKSLTHSLFIKERKWTKTGDVLWKGP